MEDKKATSIKETRGPQALRIRSTWGAKRDAVVQELQDMDQAKHDKWADRAVQCLEAAMVPAWVQAQGASDPVAFMKGLLGERGHLRFE